MESVLFVVVAITLYLACDQILQQIELKLGRRLEHRTVVFFGLLLTLSLLSFSVLRQLLSQ